MYSFDVFVIKGFTVGKGSSIVGIGLSIVGIGSSIVGIGSHEV